MIQEITSIEAEQVCGGYAICNNLSSCLSLAVNVAGAASAAVSWFNSHAGGGADETTWTNIGYSQMGA